MPLGLALNDRKEKIVEFRITDHVSEQDIQDIHRELKKYNLSKREPSENIPIGAFYEETDGTKRAGLTGEIFGNWLCIKYLWVSEELRGHGIIRKTISWRI